MFKKLLVLLLCLFLLIPAVAFAKVPDISRLTESETLELLDILLEEVSDEQLNSALQKRLNDYYDDALSTLYNIITIKVEERGIKAYQTLQNGSRGEDVQALQQRLIDLNYLTGYADGVFGNKTGTALQAFQYEVDLPQTGIADPLTQIYLFMDDAPYAPEQESILPTPTPKKQASSNGIRPEVKEAIDSYEEFFDEYCTFMKKYEKSNYSVLMLVDYLSFMESYSDTMEKLEDMENDLNGAEFAYYTQAVTRIMQKLTDLSY